LFYYGHGVLRRDAYEKEKKTHPPQAGSKEEGGQQDPVAEKDRRSSSEKVGKT